MKRQNTIAQSTVGNNAADQPVGCDRKLGELPLDPEGQNGDRAEWARVAVMAFIDETRTDHCDAISDLLCDLMHLCDRDGNFQAFDAALQRAKATYADETSPTGGW